MQKKALAFAIFSGFYAFLLFYLSQILFHIACQLLSDSQASANGSVLDGGRQGLEKLLSSLQNRDELRRQRSSDIFFILCVFYQKGRTDAPRGPKLQKRMLSSKEAA